MRIHFIAIGGAIMHNLAICLKEQGHVISGSDDEIYDPARSRLETHGLLPLKEGWDPGRISEDLDLIILGMHARRDNPELERALELGLEIQSFPEYVGHAAANKYTVVVAGSHGKTTTTSMIMHVIRQTGKSMDYLVGAQIEGFDLMVKLSGAPLIVIEGDEYLSSALDRKAKFLHYDPDVLILTGIEWDHMNVFPTCQSYFQTFNALLEKCKAGTIVLFDERDGELKKLIRSHTHIKAKPYQPFETLPTNKQVVVWEHNPYRVEIFGEHNMANMKAACLACKELGIDEEIFLEAIASFKGAAKRMNQLAKGEKGVVYRDFAHAPSKVRAAVRAVRERYPDRKLVACAELHTYSSLNKEFLPNYTGTMDPADSAAVFYSQQTLRIKKMPPIEISEMEAYFQKDGLVAFNSNEELRNWVENELEEGGVLLLMSSGTFGGMDLKEWAEGLVRGS